MALSPDRHHVQYSFLFARISAKTRVAGVPAQGNFASCGPPLDGEIVAMAGQGSTGNVIAALCSFFIPGLGQLLQGRLLMAIFQFVLAAVLWFILLGWLVHLWSILDAALYKPRA
jgi:hypothetical protein